MVDQTTVAWTYHALTGYRTAPAMLTFREFITNVKSWLRGNERWRPQVDFLVYEHYDDIFCLEAFADATVTLRDKIGLDVQDARGLVKHGSEQFEPLADNEPYADKPAHEIAALKRAGRIPRTAQLYDPSLIAEVAQMYAPDIAFYTKTTKRSCIFSGAGPEPRRAAGRVTASHGKSGGAGQGQSARILFLHQNFPEQFLQVATAPRQQSRHELLGRP